MCLSSSLISNSSNDNSSTCHHHHLPASKHVHFNEAQLHQYGTALDHPEAHRRNIWFDGQEMRSMKQTAIQLGRESNKMGLGSLLSDVYGKTDAATVQAVEAWTISCAQRRGLERFVSPDYAVRRMETRKRHILSVLKAQQRMRDEENVKDNVYITLVIGRLASALSKEARMFAHVIGSGDEKVSQCYNNTVASPVAAISKPAIVSRKRSPDSIMGIFDPFFGMADSPTTPTDNVFLQDEQNRYMIGPLV